MEGGRGQAVVHPEELLERLAERRVVADGGAHVPIDPSPGQNLRCRYAGRMVEVLGDSARGSEFALVRLSVDGERIVAAEAPGLERPLEGLTLLEAAAVGGETLAADALANALAQVFRAESHPERVAVAMSGGVDSAVALLRAGPHALGVTLRLWMDPDGPNGERACCSPGAVLAARETCHRLGLPHVTLDLREEFRRAIVAPFARGYARIVRHRGRLLLARAVDEQKDQSYMLARLDPRFLDRLWFPLGEQTKADTRAEAERAGLAAAHRPESQEACFLAGDDYRTFLARHGLAGEAGPIVDEQGQELGTHKGYWRFTPGQRRGLGVASSEPLYALRADARTNTVVVGPRDALATRTVAVRGRLYAAVQRADAKLRYRSAAVPATVDARQGGFRLRLDEPAYGVAPGQAAVLYENGVVVGSGLVTA